MYTQRNETMKQIAAAVFFVAGLALLVLFVFTIGRDKGFAEPKFQVEVLFNNVGGLTEGAPARLSGVNVGNVSGIDFLDRDVQGRKVRVTLNIFSKFRKQLEKGNRFTIKTEGVLGEKLVEIYALEDQRAVDLKQPIMGENPVDISELTEEFAMAAKSFSKAAETISAVDVVELTQVMEESSRSLLVTSQGLNDIMDEMQDITKKSKRMFDRLEQKIIEGDLFKVF